MEVLVLVVHLFGVYFGGSVQWRFESWRLGRLCWSLGAM